jgi:hypothetical protein
MDENIPTNHAHASISYAAAPKPKPKPKPRSKPQVTRNPHAAVDGRLIFIEEGLGGFEFQRKGEER